LKFFLKLKEQTPFKEAAVNALIPEEPYPQRKIPQPLMIGDDFY
jgi:hypothetical protein